MTCVATQDETIKLIRARLDILSAIDDKNGGVLCNIRDGFDEVIDEIDNGGLTQETCSKMADIFKVSHRTAQKYADGLNSIHQSMALLVPPGMNEGGKEWP